MSDGRFQAASPEPAERRTPDPYFTGLTESEEPTAVGTLFLTVIILMIIVGIWLIGYSELIGR